MKIFVIFLLTIASVTASEEPKVGQAKHGKDRVAIRNECFNLNTLTNDQFKSMKDFKLLNEEPVRNYLFCIAEKLGIFQDGKFTVDHIIEQYRMHLDVKDVTKMVEQCVPKDKDNLLDDRAAAEIEVYNFYVCLFDTEIGKIIQNAALEKPSQKSED